MTDNNFDSSSDSDFDGNLGDGATPAPDLTDRVTRLAMLLRHADMASHPGHPFGGVRAGQGRVLHVLSLRSPMPQRELAYMLGVRPQSLSEVLGKLESAGFITRERDTTDRRTFLVDLTDTGRDAAGSSPATEDPFDVLDADEQQALSDMLSRVTTALREKFPDLPERPRLRSGLRAGLRSGFRPGLIGSAGVPRPAAHPSTWQAKTSFTRVVAALLACRSDRCAAGRRPDADGCAAVHRRPHSTEPRWSV
jgi:DNA-binding MarR family transcriptional regulator